MYTRHTEVPVFEIRHGWIEARVFNQVCALLRRQSADMRIPLDGFHDLELILQKDAWIVVEKSLNDTPVVAWVDFEIRHRRDLHLPLPCRVKLYHVDAGRLSKQALKQLQQWLQAHRSRPAESATLVALLQNPKRTD